ncbi:MAG TPA: PAS domain-containing protein, partial [Desulfobacteraceae bacterium]|nr:PAS domain-containing protein [Desulfobacteraceae bacterium]
MMKKTDTPLRQQTLLLQAIIESLTYPFYVVDVKDCSIVMANAALGPVDRWQGKTCHQVTHRRDSPCTGEEDICPMAHVLRTGKPIKVEHIHYNARGEQRFVEVSGYPVFDDRGEVVQMIEYSKDITEEKKAEEGQSLLEDKLRQAQKMEAIGTLAGGIAHDFNNILTAIIGYGEMVKDAIPEGVEARQDIDQVLKAGRRAKDLVQHILTFSRQSQKEYGPIQIHLVVKEALKLLRATIPSTIEIRENINPRCGSII